jgi:hypothetical protein
MSALDTICHPGEVSRGEDVLMTDSAIMAVERLVSELGFDAVIDALVAEAETAPDDQLDAVEALLDAVMAGLVVDASTPPPPMLQ